MTQQEQQQFTESLEAALSWIQDVQDRLRANDDTQGPRDALKVRLDETKSKHEGQMKLADAQMAAQSLLESKDEELHRSTNAKLKELRNMWDETEQSITHCHSRIEWVWLRWSEYLKAYEEFVLWLENQRCSLDVDVEQQVGAKEKLWQADQQRVLLSDVRGKAAMLERLLEEAATLHSTTQDPSVDYQTQERLQESYNDIKYRSEERLALLQRISDDHYKYQDNVDKFQAFLLSKTKELTQLMTRDEPKDGKHKALDDSVACEEKTLKCIEVIADGVKANTSPAGAEVVQEEAEELRLGWQRLRQELSESGEDSLNKYTDRSQQLQRDIGFLRELLKGLDDELDHPQTYSYNIEEHIVGRWRNLTDTRTKLEEQESQVENLKAQLDELFKFPVDSRFLSEEVLAVDVELQSVKSRATRLCSESESRARSLLQEPLQEYADWSREASEVLETSAGISDFSQVAEPVRRMELLLGVSYDLHDRLCKLEQKDNLLESLFEPDKASDMLVELSDAIRRQELLNDQLLQEKDRLQVRLHLMHIHLFFTSRTEGYNRAFLSLSLNIIYFLYFLSAHTTLTQQQIMRLQFSGSITKRSGANGAQLLHTFVVCVCVCVCVQKPRLLARVCRVALLLWFLLLALLLLASFLLPFVDESNSCSFTNNFARSFNIMLRYHGPPPT
uniref:Spectrin repeat containing, nuclear envelope family member 3 n=1 Tax=Oryzias sinensis TaxID=183150 RepID=A0A8C8DPH2_9TELE